MHVQVWGVARVVNQFHGLEIPQRPSDVHAAFEDELHRQDVHWIEWPRMRHVGRCLSVDCTEACTEIECMPERHSRRSKVVDSRDVKNCGQGSGQLSLAQDVNRGEMFGSALPCPALPCLPASLSPQTHTTRLGLPMQPLRLCNRAEYQVLMHHCLESFPSTFPSPGSRFFFSSSCPEPKFLTYWMMPKGRPWQDALCITPDAVL